MIIETGEGERRRHEDDPGDATKNGSVHDMRKSGARGSLGPITQMMGMKGIVMNTVGVRSTSRSFPRTARVSPIEYFITTHGARKGLTDTALQTAKAGYLTRRLVDVAQDVVISEDDCGDKAGRRVYLKKNVSGIGTSLEKVIADGLRRKILRFDGTIIVKRKKLSRK